LGARNDGYFGALVSLCPFLGNVCRLTDQRVPVYIVYLSWGIRPGQIVHGGTVVARPVMPRLKSGST
jgi:hypothetical protein